MAHYIALTCEALARSVYAAAATSPHVITVQLFRQGLHDTPRKLRFTLQDAVDAIPSGSCEALLLGYGLCGLATAGLTARDVPLVIPRAHDCITLYLGSRARYDAEFSANPGTYWYSRDYLERREPGTSTALGAASLENNEALYEEYVQKYGKDNADYLMQTMSTWRAHYDRAAFIDMGDGDSRRFQAIAAEQAAQNGWRFDQLQGDRRLIEQLIHGDWPEADFLIVPPGHRIQQSVESGLVSAVPVEPSHD